MKNMHHTLISSLCIPAFIVVCLAFSMSNGQTPIRLLINPSNAFLIGASYSYNSRQGVYEFSDAQKNQNINRSNLTVLGCQAGKRFQLNKKLRIQINGLFEQGSVWDTAIIKYDFTHIGIEPQLQYSLPTYDNFTPYVFVGTGLHYLSAKEHIYFVSGGQKEEWSDLPNNNSSKLSISGNAGFGIDFPLTSTLLFNASYLFRYWQPVSYSDGIDFPLYPPAYHEVFYSSVFQVNLMFSFK